MDKLSKFNFAITVYTKLIISIKSLTRSTRRKFMKISVTKYSQDSDNHTEEDGFTKKNTFNYQYPEKKSKSKKKIIINSKVNDLAKNSLYSSSSRMTSFLKGNSISEPEIPLFKQTQSAYYNQLTQKYLVRGAPEQKIKQQMLLSLQRKVSELEALRIHRDQLKFISYNNPYNNPIKISFAVLKEKAKAQQNIRETIDLLQKDIKQIDYQFNAMTDYYNFVMNSLTYTGDEDLIIDTQEEQKLMIQNLEKETNHLFRELRETDKKNGKQIKQMQSQIGALRVSIKQKQDKIRDLKSKICTMYIKLHSRNSSSKEKNVSLSIRKFNNDQHVELQQAFIGNRNFKTFSKQTLQKVNEDDELLKIVFYSQGKQNIAFRCIYKSCNGKLHKNTEEVVANGKQMSPKKILATSEIIQTEISVKYLLSMKFFFKSKIVGVQCRVKTQKGNKHLQIGNCNSNVQHQLLTLINKKIVTLGSFWHQKQMIGVGVWYANKLHSSRNLLSSSKSKGKTLKNVRFQQRLKNQTYEEYYS